MKRLLLFLFFTVFAPFLAAQPEKQDADWYDTTARNAINKENYEFAVKILREGIKKFPEEVTLNLRLADLFYGEELYEPALKEYLAADRKQPGNFNTMNSLQDCYSLLNEEEKAIGYLEQMLELFPMQTNPESYYSVQDLSWLYFKTHRLEEAEFLLLEHINQREEHQPKRNLRITLGTVYSGMHAYRESKENYLASIREALDYDDNYFASVAYYNLSLLEIKFNHFNSALQYTEESLRCYDRPTGHLVKGELFQARLEYANALREYKEGKKLDNTPMTNINLAVLYSTFGSLDNALAMAREVYESRDLSWLANFGTDKEQHLMEMHELLADIYHGLERREKLLPETGLTGAIVSFFRGLSYRLREYYHRQQFKSLALRTGQVMLQEHNFLDAYMLFFEANKNYPEVARKYLNLAGEFEIPLNPQSAPYYRMLKGVLLRSPDLLKQAAGEFDPFWEKQSLHRSLLATIPLIKKASLEQRQLLSQAYALNPGGLAAAGYGVPLRLELSFTGDLKKREKWVRRGLKKAGSFIWERESDTGSPLEEGYRFLLRLDWREGGLPYFTFIDQQSGKVVAKGNIDPGEGSPRKQSYSFIRRLLKEHLYHPSEV